MSEEQAAPTRRSTDIPDNAPWWAKWFVANVNEAWHWASNRWSIACAVAAETYAEFPDQINDAVQKLVPPAWYPHLIAGAFAMTALWRIINLKRPKPGDSTQEKTP